MSDNIKYDEESAREEMTRLRSEVSYINDRISPERERSAVDYYTGLVTAWKEAGDVIDIVPNSISQITNNSNLPQQKNNLRTAPNTGYDSLYLDLEEKIDATYDKLCSLEQADTDMVDGMCHIKNSLDDIYKKIENMHNEMATLYTNQKEMMTILMELKNISRNSQ